MKVKIFNITKLIDEMNKVSNRSFEMVTERISKMREDEEGEDECYSSFSIKVITDKYISEIKSYSSSAIDIEYFEKEDGNEIRKLEIKEIGKSSGENGFILFGTGTIKENFNNHYCNVSEINRLCLPFGLSKEDFIEDYEIATLNVPVALTENELETLIKDVKDEILRAKLFETLNNSRIKMASNFL